MDTLKRTFKIIGCGAVVSGFLRDMVGQFPQLTFEVYARSGSEIPRLPGNVRFLPLNRFRADKQDVVFFCCSVDERKILRNSPEKRSRLAVARANLGLTSEFIKKGVFRQGTYFILTNPSDLIAEYIFNQTGNRQVFALGLSADHRRYLKIFEGLGVSSGLTSEFTLGGNHWDHPVPIFDCSAELNGQLLSLLNINASDQLAAQVLLLTKLRKLLQHLIQSEFSGFKPPVRSGVLGLTDTIRVLSGGGQILVSGIAPGLRNFVGGSLRSRSSGSCTFKPHLPREASTEFVLAQTFERHRLVLDQLAVHPTAHKTTETNPIMREDEAKPASKMLCAVRMIS